MKKLIVVSILIVFTINVQGQYTYSTKSKKAIKYFEQALNSYNRKEDSLTVMYLQKAIYNDSTFIEAYTLLATQYHEQKKYEEEKIAYRKTIQINPDYSYKIYMFLGKAELQTGEYEIAKKNLEHALKMPSTPIPTKEMINTDISKCNVAINLKNNPVPFNPINIGSNINSELNEYQPTLTMDEQTLIFVRAVKRDAQSLIKSAVQEDFFISNKINGSWDKAELIGPPLNTYFNEGAQSISADGLSFYFTRCLMQEDGGCQIYYSHKVGDSWTDPMPLGSPVNTNHWESQPSISSDGITLYFVSNRPGGKGKMDIWKAIKKGERADGLPIFGELKNLGDSINTEEDEMSPFIHPDNKTLYFSSTGWDGLGGFDIFVIRKKTDNTWTKPVNIGYPINTYKNDAYLIVNAKGNLAYFSSDREKNNGLDIYYFELHSKAQPTMVSYVTGKVYDAITRKPLSVKFDLTNLSTGTPVIFAESNQITGKFLVCLPSGNDYCFNASKEGYLFYSENFSLTNQVDSLKPIELDIAMKPIKMNESIALRNVFFDTDKYDLKPESKVELNKVIQFLLSNPSIKIEIGGHTDNQASAEYNLKLSNNRAKAVYDYLIANSINANRLSYKGYGLTQPIDSNNTETGRAKNRRTEIKIIGIE